MFIIPVALKFWPGGQPPSPPAPTGGRNLSIQRRPFLHDRRRASGRKHGGHGRAPCRSFWVGQFTLQANLVSEPPLNYARGQAPGVAVLTAQLSCRRYNTGSLLMLKSCVADAELTHVSQQFARRGRRRPGGADRRGGDFANRWRRRHGPATGSAARVGLCPCRVIAGARRPAAPDDYLKHLRCNRLALKHPNWKILKNTLLCFVNIMLYNR